MNGQTFHLGSLAADIFVQSALLMSAGLIVTTYMRRSSAANRHLVLTLTIFATAALPIAIALQPRQKQHAKAAISISAPQIVQPPIASQAATTTPTPDSHAAQAPGLSIPEANRTAITMPNIEQILLFVWLAGVLVCGARIAAGLVALKQLERRSSELQSAETAAIVLPLCKSMGIEQPISILIAAHEEVLASPLTWGARRPRILLPAGSGDIDNAALRSILAHELAHVQRGDWAIHLFTQAMCAFYWLQPLMTPLMRRQRFEAERACDDTVVTGGIMASEYAGHLVEMARWIGAQGRRHPFASTMADKKDLPQRVTAILDQHQNRRAMGRPILIAATACAVLALLIIARLQPVAIAETLSLNQQPDLMNNTSSHVRTITVDGITIEIAGITSSIDAQGEDWWSADGTRLISAPPMNNDRFHQTLTGGGLGKPLTLFLNIRSPRNLQGFGTAGYLVDATGQLAGKGYRIRTAAMNDGNVGAGSAATGWMQISMPEQIKTFNYFFGIATGPWETIATTNTGFHSETMDQEGGSRKVSQKAASIALGSKPVLVYTDLEGKRHEQSLLGDAHELANVDRRIVAIDSEGNTISLAEPQTDMRGENIVTIEPEELVKIAKIQLQTRPFEWKQFQNIAADASTPMPIKPVFTMPATLPAYKHQFANGFTLNIEAVHRMRAEGDEWWQPNGHALTGRPKSWENIDVETGWNVKEHPRWIAYSVDGPKDAAYNLAYRIQAPGDKDEPFQNRVSENKIGSGNIAWFDHPFPAGLQDCMVQVGIASGEWKTIVTRDVQFNAGTLKRRDVAPAQDEQGDVAFVVDQQVMLAYYDKGGALHKETLADNKDGKLACRLVAVMNDGTSKILKECGGTYSGSALELGLDPHSSVNRYNPGIKLDQIKQIQLQGRTYEWADIKNIALQPQAH